MTVRQLVPETAVLLAVVVVVIIIWGYGYINIRIKPSYVNKAFGTFKLSGMRVLSKNWGNRTCIVQLCLKSHGEIKADIMSIFRLPIWREYHIGMKMSNKSSGTPFLTDKNGTEFHTVEPNK